MILLFKLKKVALLFSSKNKAIVFFGTFSLFLIFFFQNCSNSQLAFKVVALQTEAAPVEATTDSDGSNSLELPSAASPAEGSFTIGTSSLNNVICVESDGMTTCDQTVGLLDQMDVEDERAKSMCVPTAVAMVMNTFIERGVDFGVLTAVGVFSDYMEKTNSSDQVIVLADYLGTTTDGGTEPSKVNSKLFKYFNDSFEFPLKSSVSINSKTPLSPADAEIISADAIEAYIRAGALGVVATRNDRMETITTTLSDGSKSEKKIWNSLGVGHEMVIRGFEKTENQFVVLVSDPNGGVMQRYILKKYTHEADSSLDRTYFYSEDYDTWPQIMKDMLKDVYRIPLAIKWVQPK